MQSPVLILGASGGLGSAIARRMASDGIPLILHGRSRERVEALASSLSADATRRIELADLSREDDVAALFGRLRADCGELGGVVFSVATPFPNRLTHRLAWSVFSEQLDGQVKALHLAASAALPLLESRTETRRFVVISTEFVLGMPPIKTAPYVAAKAAMTTYAQVIAQEWLGRGIRVHIVAPGLVRTGLVADMPDAYLEQLAEQMPEKRLTSGADVAEFVRFLFTDAADPLYGVPLQLSRGVRR